MTLIWAIGAVLALEGIAYALFPQGMQRMAAMAASMAPDSLRMMGVVALAIGVGLIWLVSWLGGALLQAS